MFFFYRVLFLSGLSLNRCLVCRRCSVQARKRNPFNEDVGCCGLVDGRSGGLAHSAQQDYGRRLGVRVERGELEECGALLYARRAGFSPKGVSE